MNALCAHPFCTVIYLLFKTVSVHLLQTYDHPRGQDGRVSILSGLLEGAVTCAEKIPGSQASESDGREAASDEPFRSDAQRTQRGSQSAALQVSKLR